MKIREGLIAAALLIACITMTAAITYFLFPREVQRGIPTIKTVWDTVTVVEPRLDTVWRTRTLARVETLPNVIDTVTIQRAPDTVYLDTLMLYSAVCPQQLQVGQYGERDDPTIIEGKTITTAGDTSQRSILEQPWRVTYFTPGPLDAVVGDTFPPRVTFRRPPNECGFWCRAGLISLGVLAGTGVTGTACAVSHAR